MRLAWFSPLPPVHSGISAYSLDVLEGLAPGHAVDLFVDDGVWRAHDRAGTVTGSSVRSRLHAGDGPRIAPVTGPLGLPLYRAYDFPILHGHAPYDLIVYQMGNAAAHRFMWPYLLRWPGLVVLHDGALHHARAAALLRDKRDDDYRAEFRFNHPGIDPRVADFVVEGLEGSPYYLWPMLRTVLARARGVAVHADPLRRLLAESHPDTPLTTIAMGVPDPWLDVARDAPTTGAVTLAAFGLITPEKRILPILRALAALRTEVPGIRLRLVGEIGEHYALWKDVARTGTRDLVEVTGYVSDAQLDDELRRADVCLCLRWPTAHETSASWLRCLAAGKATVITDQLTTVDVPTLDPRHWVLKHRREDAAAVFQPQDASHAVAVSVELSDEGHMVREALHRLALDAALRTSLGQRAREWWEAHHTRARMWRDYARTLDWAVALPEPSWPDDAPAHLRPDPAEWARSLTAPFDLTPDLMS